MENILSDIHFIFYEATVKAHTRTYCGMRREKKVFTICLSDDRMTLCNHSCYLIENCVLE